MSRCRRRCPARWPRTAGASTRRRRRSRRRRRWRWRLPRLVQRAIAAAPAEPAAAPSAVPSPGGQAASCVWRGSAWVSLTRDGESGLGVGQGSAARWMGLTWHGMANKIFKVECLARARKSTDPALLPTVQPSPPTLHKNLQYNGACAPPARQQRPSTPTHPWAAPPARARPARRPQARPNPHRLSITGRFSAGAGCGGSSLG